MLAHDVFFSLNDTSPEAVDRLVRSCHSYLKDHPGLVFYAAGVLAKDCTRDVNDRNFDVAQFIEGARSAYGMILEAFWQGNRDDLRWLCDADVAQSFEEAIAQREADGHVLENRLVRVEKSQIIEASCTAGVAHITLQFDADIAAITRDKDGNVIAGSMSDAVASHDIWTFSRRIGDADPNWKLSETDEAA